MPDRDNELDELQRALRADDPHLEKPDEMEVDLGGACFLDMNRVCGGDCTAYLGPHGATASERCRLLFVASLAEGYFRGLTQIRKGPVSLNIEPPLVGRKP